MNTVKTRRKIKTLIVSIAACLTLVLSAVFSFGMFDGKYSAADSDEPPVTNEVGLRFVQVAAGRDFAIGLTYDGKLYGWSLYDSNNGLGAGASSLGRYYTSEPTEINVKFVLGPGNNGTVDWSNEDEKTGYHAPDTNGRKIIQIAATSTTAAFITDNGYIYTWGKDVQKDLPSPAYSNVGSEGSNYHYLLLRTPDSSKSERDWYNPYIIQYDYYKKMSSTESPEYALSTVLAKSSQYSDFSIAAGENNYILVYRLGSEYYSYVWGSVMYVNTQTEGNDDRYNFTSSAESTEGFTVEDNSSIYRYIYHTRFRTGDTVTAVAGGYNVAMNGKGTGSVGDNTTSLMLRGRNFITTGGLTKTGQETVGGKTYEIYEPTVTVATSSVPTGTTSIVYEQDGTNYLIKNGIIGGNGGGAPSNGTIAQSTGTYYGVQLAKAGGSATDNLNYSVSQPAKSGVYNAEGVEIDAVSINGRNIKAIRNAVSLGNDVGYGINDADGQLYAWGDNKLGQSGRGTADQNYSYPTKTLEGKYVIAVAAGKQLSASDNGRKAFNDSATFDTSAGVAFSENVYNKGSFITGAIVNENDGISDANAGSLWVWSDKKNTPEKIEIGNSSDEYNKFVAVYSGYGANLFAITKLGKIVRIYYDEADSTGEFKFKVYDDFRGTDGRLIDNWTVAENGDNMFKVAGLDSTADHKTEKLASFTLFVNNGISDKSSTKLNGASNDALDPLYYGSDRGSLVTENKIGDVYRILDYNSDTSIRFMKTDDTLAKTTLEPKFYFKAAGQANSVLMGEAQRNSLLDYDIVYDDNYGVGIKIMPKQSSKLGTVSVEFYIARYDCQTNFRITSNSRPTDNKAQYYEYKPCRVDFVIDNTAAFQTFDSYRNNGQGNANVPLLDPNNKDNKVYSVAVQNISLGADELAKHLTNNNATNKAKLLDAIKKAMIDKDLGYPDAAKIARGNLDYYLGAAEASRAYSGTYQWLFEDIDADVIQIQELSDERFEGAVSGAVDKKVNKIDIKLDNLGSLNISEDIASAFFTDFNNLYGIYNVGFTVESGIVTALEFSYDVVTFTASNTTGALVYNSGSVSDYATTGTDGNARMSFSINTYYEYTRYNADYRTDLTATDAAGRVVDTWSNFADVFSQASVRLKADDGNGHSLKPEGGDVAYGDASERRNKIYIEDTRDIAVGETVKLELSRYIESYGAFVSFSHNNKRDDYGSFNSQFPDKLGRPGETYVKLNESTLEITPSRAFDIDIEVSIQRFYGADNAYFDGGDEKITLVFTFTGVKPVDLRDSGAKKTFPVSKEGVVDIFGRTSNGTAGAVNEAALISVDQRYIRNNKIELQGLKSSNAEVLSVTPIDNKSFRITPKNSGVAHVQFAVSVYDKSVPIILTFNVSGITQVTTGKDKDPLVVALDGTRYVYISELKTALHTAVGSFNDDIDDYTVLYTDVNDSGMLNAIYFTEWTESTNAESEPIVGYPSYVKSVTFQDYTSGNDNKSYIRITMNDEASDMSKVYKMHVRFIDGTANYTSYQDAKDKGGAIIETTFIVKSTKQIAQGPGGGMLTIDADVDKPKKQNENNINSDWYMSGSNIEAKIYVPLEYLFACAGLQPDNYSVFLVTASDNATNYINYTFDSKRVIITPLYDTPENTVIALNVSTRSSRSSESNQVIAFSITVKGISTTLSKQEYTTIWLVAFFASFGLLFIIFIIRLIVYWRRRAKQRALIKRNQELIKMRDRIHNRAGVATREQVVKTKLKMEDPKYAKMFGEMKRDRNGDPGVTLENSDFGVGADDDKKSKKKKKKGGKKSMAELKAELAAKKAAFAQAQQGGVGGQPFGGAAPMDSPVFEAQSYGAEPMNGGYPNGGDGFGGQPFGDAPMNGGFGSPVDGYSQSDLDGNAIIFDATDDGVQG